MAMTKRRPAAKKRATPPPKRRAALRLVTEEPGPRFTGGCCCGAVKYVVRGKLGDVITCHCSKCRRWHGHVGAYTACKRSALDLEEKSGLSWFKVSAKVRRGFCKKCGSSLFFDALGDEAMFLAAGTLDGPTGLSMRAHFFVGSKGDYYELPEFDRTVRFEGYPE